LNENLNEMLILTKKKKISNYARDESFWVNSNYKYSKII